jgi:hypothetical protein
MKTKIVALVLASAGALWGAPAAAQDNTVRAGIYIVRYNAKADDISGPFAPAGLNLDLKNVNTAYFAYLRRLTPSIEIELAAGWPPKTETIGKGPDTVGSVP